MNKLKVLELFSGIRATSEALNRLGVEHTTTTVEYDKKVQDVANKLWGTNEPTRDITKFTPDGEYDLVVGGFPCQPFSMAGKQQGFNDEKGRGTLYQDTLRVIKKANPTYIILENVKAITFQKHKWIITEIENTLKKWGYKINTQIINAKNYLPQNRERVFIMASKINQPNKIKNKKHNFILKDFLDKKVDKSFYIDKNKADKNGERKWLFLNNYAGPEAKNFPNATDGTNRFYYETATHKGAQLASSAGKIMIKKNEKSFKLRHITPREAWRLMGWKETQINKVIDLPKSKLYHTAGNSMVIPVMEDVCKELLKGELNEIK